MNSFDDFGFRYWEVEDTGEPFWGYFLDLQRQGVDESISPLGEVGALVIFLVLASWLRAVVSGCCWDRGWRRFGIHMDF
jgi:hypothetical protein